MYVANMYMEFWLYMYKWKAPEYVNESMPWYLLADFVLVKGIEKLTVWKNEKKTRCVRDNVMCASKHTIRMKEKEQWFRRVYKTNGWKLLWSTTEKYMDSVRKDKLWRQCVRQCFSIYTMIVVKIILICNLK
jgi:hypothetical protein